MAKNIITEDEIEQATIGVFKSMGYRHLNGFHKDTTGRTSENEVVIKTILGERLRMLNSHLPTSAIETAVQTIAETRLNRTTFQANVSLYEILKRGVDVEVKLPNGKSEPTQVKVFDFEHPENNDFLVTSQLWIQGTFRLRPDLIVFVNGIPIVFIELKNSNIAIREAYDDNIVRYKKDIPLVFNYNTCVILSNGIETKVGSITSSWNHFKPWLRPDKEDEEPNLQRIQAEGISLEYAVRGICEPHKLLDYFQNFVLYHKGSVKIVAQNHQFLGVNNVITKLKSRLQHDTDQTDIVNKSKLGVFWHTQGSGKSYSMVFLTKKIITKFTGNYTFLIVTDREDLDRQIKKNYLSAGVISELESKSQPASSEALRAKLQTSPQYVFTLIHKFRFDKGKDYPVLSTRKDIIVIVDEAHRTQYKDLAINMRKGLPNAKFLAFTGTPLLGSKKLTNDWFGEIVSEYNFKQSIEDGATVPLFYQNRKPKVSLQNEDLEENFDEIVQEDDLTEDQLAKLETEFAKELSVIRADDRLETIARDIVTHFPRRGFLGKGMVISIDKFTTVRMYDKVKRLWEEEKRVIQSEIKEAKTTQEKESLKKTLEWMRKLDMAVVISEEAGEDEKFAKQGLSVKHHRDRIDSTEEDIEEKFKAETDPLSLVFVCNKWLTGFDAPTVSTLYLDKPMRDHTLMQTIARANRVSEITMMGKEKTNGLVVDYYGVFRNLKKAFASYGGGSWDGEDNPVDLPVQEKSQLFVLLSSAIEECVTYCKTLEIDLTRIHNEAVTFEKVGLFNEFANKILAEDEQKKLFFVYENTVEALYEACKPDIIPRREEFRLKDVICYLRDVIEGKAIPVDIDKTKRKVHQLLDESIISDNKNAKGFEIKPWSKINLSTLNLEKLQEEFKVAPYKNIEIADLKAFIEEKLNQMLSANSTRTPFAEKLAEIIERYNNGNTPEDYFADLLNFVSSLREEDLRAKREELTEEQLEIFDLLQKEDLSTNEKERVKDAAKNLLKRLKEERPTVMITDWHKDTQTKKQVESVIKTILDSYLPQSYSRPVYTDKCERVFTHFYTQAMRGGSF